jgi:hypothetical protein
MSSNWNNLIFSSGKIATYLWAGLAVLTNIDHPLTKSPPFLYIPEITSEAILNALHTYQTSIIDYQNAAFKCAKKYYNLDISMGNIYKTILTKSVEIQYSFPKKEILRKILMRIFLNQKQNIISFIHHLIKRNYI